MNLEHVTNVLRESGYRITPQRIEVVKIVLEKLAERSHPTFNDILNEVKQVMPSISASTVYSILELLEEVGLVTSFEHNGRTYYDNVTPHLNVVCINTERVIDIEGEEFVKVLNKYGVHPTTILIRGICSQ